jgi:hypothetical protein
MHAKTRSKIKSMKTETKKYQARHGNVDTISQKDLSGYAGLTFINIG